ncbi:ImmA/IrrE family metallo-endopeptidase [Leptospira bandrabouensis]|uniref:ImmA/IrrE family metallo-endopeptidase n=1 Tax=Leptospira bandrabouensis TaxID=2484903 RepID=A0A6H3NNE1_9LEPT|nr:ImmA/IrrE family metallo-endopeptidase [Leptospira bandrabouensis]TGN13489.1 ImmA/IrrE family metallo-endopeptidase [Leptospira bandrabouensis]
MKTKLNDISPETLQMAEPCRLNRKEIEEKAEEFAREISYEPAADLESIVETIGGEVIYQPLSDWEKSHEASIIILGPTNFQINLSNFHGPLRNRFSIAHELGHFVLHSDKGKKQIRAARFGNTLEEQEANLFAAALLMPRKKFREEIEKNRDPIHLAAKFLVSLTAAKVRMDYLGNNPY